MIREEIRDLVLDQYELGWRSVIDIDILTDKILTLLNLRLDLDVEPLYNGLLKGYNYEKSFKGS